jgi:hypothetical protein
MDSGTGSSMEELPNFGQLDGRWKQDGVRQERSHRTRVTRSSYSDDEF